MSKKASEGAREQSAQAAGKQFKFAALENRQQPLQLQK